MGMCKCGQSDEFTHVCPPFPTWKTETSNEAFEQVEALTAGLEAAKTALRMIVNREGFGATRIAKEALALLEKL